MKFFSWTQNKFDGGQVNRKRSTVQTTNQRNQEARKEEFNDWPNSLLAIGTFGNTSNLKDQNRERPQHVHEDEILEQTSSPDLAEFTPEEVGKLQKELKNLLSRKPANKYEGEIYTNGDLPLDRFLNCPSSLEVDRIISRRCSTDSDNYEYDEEEIERTIRVIIGRCKDVCKENKNKAIWKKSVSFFLKKMFSGFAPIPSLRDTLPESRMDKLLRTLLSKKINTQKASPASSAKKYLEDRQKPREEEAEEKRREKTCNGSKWVKTDTEFIVLEI